MATLSKCTEYIQIPFECTAKHMRLSLIAVSVHMIQAAHLQNKLFTIQLTTIGCNVMFAHSHITHKIFSTHTQLSLNESIYHLPVMSNADEQYLGVICAPQANSHHPHTRIYANLRTKNKNNVHLFEQ